MIRHVTNYHQAEMKKMEQLIQAIKGYPCYKTITSQYGLYEAQVRNAFVL